MDFGLTGEQQALRDAARRFARGELSELARELEARNEPVPLAMRRRYAEMGFLGVNVPEEYGGLGLGHLEALLVLEEFAQVSPAVAFPVFESATGPVRTVLHFAPEALRWRIVPQVVRGEIVVAVSMSEPGAGTALTDLDHARSHRDRRDRRHGAKTLVQRRRARRRLCGLLPAVAMRQAPPASAPCWSRKIGRA